MSDRIQGVVKFFADDKGYGFITPVDGSKDIFVHRSDLMDGIRELKSEQKVSYVVATSDRTKGDGRKAAEVRVDA